MAELIKVARTDKPGLNEAGGLRENSRGCRLHHLRMCL